MRQSISSETGSTMSFVAMAAAGAGDQPHHRVSFPARVIIWRSGTNA
jgi:hypothetical protein